MKKKTQGLLDEKFRNLKMFFKKEKSQNVPSGQLSPLPRPKNQWNLKREANEPSSPLTMEFVKKQYAACNNFDALEILHQKLNAAYERESAQIEKLEKDIEEVEQTLKFDKVRIQNQYPAVTIIITFVGMS